MSYLNFTEKIGLIPLATYIRLGREPNLLNFSTYSVCYRNSLTKVQTSFSTDHQTATHACTGAKTTLRTDNDDPVTSHAATRTET